jgi:peptidoglycan/xylan/chitin deacetylase (PgdA/CDA1 family)
MTGALGSALTVVMYHYVRPLAGSAFPRLKALDLHRFRAQLEALQARYRLIGPQDLAAHVTGAAPLPPEACLLTFDDGYSDHYAHVFPELRARGLTGLFFAPRASLLDRQVLEVNMVQFTLAAMDRPERLAEDLDACLRAEGLGDPVALWAAYGQPNRFDPAPVAYAKRLLQHALPPDVRSLLAERMFRRHVTADVAGFAEALYLTPSQAMEMRAEGMEFGGHGDRHLWHGRCSAAELAAEVAGSVAALRAIGAPVAGGFYCYPFGSEGDAVVQAVAGAGFAIGFTVDPRVADTATMQPLRIPRLDTNDLPFAGAAA